MRPLTLTSHQLGANGAVRGDGTDRRGHLVGADVGREIGSVDEHTGLADVEVDLARQRRHRLDIGWVDAPAYRRERDGAVHRTGVEVLQAETSSECTRDGALAGTGRPIDGDDPHLPARPLRQPLAVPGGTLHTDDGTLVEFGDRRCAGIRACHAFDCSACQLGARHVAA